MDIILFVSMVVYVVGLSLCYWARRCNESTRRDRREIIWGAPFSYLIDLDLVPYYKHFWCKFFFRDPKVLYSERIRSYLP